jgi:hypothetical protein
MIEFRDDRMRSESSNRIESSTTDSRLRISESDGDDARDADARPAESGEEESIESNRIIESNESNRIDFRRSHSVTT